VGIEPEEVFDETRDDYVMKKEVGAKYEVIDQALEAFNYSLKRFFQQHLKAGKWQGGCIACRMVDVKKVPRGALAVLKPSLFFMHHKKHSN
jgi:hypothetical protein